MEVKIELDVRRIELLLDQIVTSQEAVLKEIESIKASQSAYEAPSTQLLRLKDVVSRTGLSRSSIYLTINLGEFSPNHRVGYRSVRWLATEIASWIQNRVR